MMKKEFRDWLEEKKRDSTYSNLNNGKLINPSPDIEKELQLVIKKYDELHKPAVIPQYVAEYLEFAKKEASLIQVMETASVIGGCPTMKKVFGWISANDETFARAWLDGYEVEDEPLYYALVKGHELLDDVAKYWAHNKYDLEDLFISYETRDDSPIVVKNTKNHWDDLGINDSNADFVKVDE